MKLLKWFVNGLCNISNTVFSDIAWADWFGTFFSALAFIYLYKQVKLQKQQIDEHTSYNRSMEFFKLIKEDESILDNFLSKFLLMKTKSISKNDLQEMLRVTHAFFTSILTR